jgi:hypothetical protein
MVSSFCQSNNSVDVMPHWKIGETHSVKIKSTTKENNNGVSQNYISTFDAKFIVKEVSDSFFKVEWVYLNPKLADNQVVLENSIIAKLTNVKLLIKLSDVGRFIELINADEVKINANKAIDELIAATAADPTMNTQYKAMKQAISTKQGLEILILKPIKFYNFSFGFNYDLNHIQTNNIKFPNPLGGQPFSAIEKVQMTKLDKKNSICIIETNKSITDSKSLKSSITDFAQKTGSFSADEIKNFDNANIEMSESTMQQIDFSKGVVQKSFFKRTINLGFQNRTTLMEIETLD